MTQFSGHQKIKREDVGQFDPHYNDPDDIGIVCDGRNMVFTDVFSLEDRLRLFLKDDTTAQSAEKQLLSMLQTLLSRTVVV